LSSIFLHIGTYTGSGLFPAGYTPWNRECGNGAAPRGANMPHKT
jgi:hypothetical protein